MEKLSGTNLYKDVCPGTRYNGGWAKKIIGLNKTKTNGFSLLGSFVDNGKSGDYIIESGKLYLDCGIGGSRKNQEKQYKLFTIHNDELIILAEATSYRGTNHTWATELWPEIEKFLGAEKENPLEKFSDAELLAELKKRGIN